MAYSPTQRIEIPEDRLYSDRLEKNTTRAYDSRLQREANAERKRRNENIAAHLRYGFENTKKTLAEVARHIGITRSAVHTYVTGIRRPPMNRLRPLCKLLDLNIRDVLSD